MGNRSKERKKIELGALLEGLFLINFWNTMIRIPLLRVAFRISLYVECDEIILCKTWNKIFISMGALQDYEIPIQHMVLEW